ncbi:LLM class flavin-dependent oxidoreductase [Halobacillus naozhouensis]|uniref:LLM class flavin-dependent oxidoreductase n=1 Tax=Halobacillus naozhouensis TaxID=554880 RepID=A0ABY8IUG0_9BACI|nr:LLM class flavin-dependent oxidoreductase [Halobacillus naozhouensis]WFT73417.1 LLM class flavin-dependent oxidoreductase [Halobacillus naozhouensis]
MKLSILDQSPVSSGTTAEQALKESMKLAKIGEVLGFERYWIAEHHDIAGFSCPAPEVMLGYIGANTESIRIGSGAVLLPHYKPYRIAETYNMLATLFPERIDIGIGRAPGGSAEATMALSDNFLEQVRRMPESVDELLHFLNHDFPSDHLFSKVSASPRPAVLPEVWMLGTSEKSALLAAGKGTAYAFGHFMSNNNDPEIIQTYKHNFRQSGMLQQPHCILAVTVMCSETSERAEEIARSSLLWGIQRSKGEEGKGVPSVEEAKRYSFSIEEQKKLEKMKKKMVIGNPKTVKQNLIDLQRLYLADEIMIITITYDYGERIQSYKLIAEEILSN